jgi:hypothetical protein
VILAAASISTSSSLAYPHPLIHSKEILNVLWNVNFLLSVCSQVSLILNLTLKFNIQKIMIKISNELISMIRIKFSIIVVDVVDIIKYIIIITKRSSLLSFFSWLDGQKKRR